MEINTLKRISPFILPIVAAILPICVVFFNEKPIPYFIGILLLFSLFEKEKKKNIISCKNFIKPYISIILCYLLYSFVSIDFIVAIKVLERQTSLLLIPLIIFSTSFNNKRFRYFFKTFLISMTIISFFSIGKLFWFIHENGDWIRTMNELQGDLTYLQFKFPHIIGVHPTYWSYLLCICNILLLNNKNLKIGFNKFLIIGLLILFNLNILYVSARTPLFINLLLHIIFVLMFFRKKKKTVIVSLIVLVSFFILAFIQLPLLKAKVLSITSDERVYLWSKALNIIKDNYFLLGEGLGQVKGLMREFIIKNGDPRVYYKGYDLHNQYLTHYLDMGILGLITLLYLILNPILIIQKKLNRENLQLIQFSLLIILSIFTEASLYLIKGVIIFSIFSSIFLKYYQIKAEKDFVSKIT